ncbi:MAG: hypothetical protein QOD00_651 [Blastocatellia bacterium]|jgi:PAS domain S-box-containing protein|nr:hypothetical protein [Blastocatellia bacterium]
MRARGPVAPPDDVAIVAIDEASIARFGRFPWSRDLTARAVEKIASAQPKVIALDVLYSEPSTDANDAALADSIERAGNVVVAAQLVDAADKKDERLVQWLRPLPSIERVAAGVGHVNILTEADGEARELPLRKSDNEGSALWSIAVEAIRVGDGLRKLEVQDIPGAVHLGRRKLLLANDESKLRFTPSEANNGVVNLRADRMVIDYIGPSGSFAPSTFSFADVLDGKVPAEKLRGKYVLVGATAATLGDHVASPFLHLEGADRNQHGALMPGVEVLANAVNTILRERFYRETPDWLALLCAALAAAAVILALTVTQGRFETLKQLCALGGLVIALLLLSYLAFTRWLLIPPVVPALISMATAAPLLLLSRSLVTSADLDERIAELSSADRWLTQKAQVKVSEQNLRSSPAEMIARLIEAESVAIFARTNGSSHEYQLVAAYGRSTVSSLSKEEILQATPLGIDIGSSHTMAGDSQPPTSDGPRGSLFGGPGDEQQNHSSRTLTLRVGKPEDPAGALLIGYQVTREPHSELLRLCLELTASYVARIAGDALEADTERVRSLSSVGWRLPRGVEWKARALGLLQRRLMARARFIDRALRSIEDGLIVADIDGRILFANPRAAEIFGVTERALIESNLFERINEDEDGASQHDQSLLRRAERETLVRLVVERLPVEREIALGDAPVRYYMLRLSAVAGEDDGAVLGLVASLSDVTKQRELQQTKDDVMMLVTHELRTPLTAIQGMSEVLSQYDVEQERRREMHLAINEEAKRLARMINDYLDITRLESGARPLRLAPTRIAPLVERALLMLDPLAAQEEKRIVRRFAPNLPPLLVDGDLLAQAVTNLVANAIKYSNPGSEIVVDLRADSRDALRVEVADQGHGIPAESLSRIFEKFYRVLRLEDADVSGTGLGLAFVREIAEKHGGRVTVESEEGVGSVFAMRLPLSFKGE